MLRSSKSRAKYFWIVQLLSSNSFPVEALISSRLFGKGFSPMNDSMGSMARSDIWDSIGARSDGIVCGGGELSTSTTCPVEEEGAFDPGRRGLSCGCSCVSISERVGRTAARP